MLRTIVITLTLLASWGAALAEQPRVLFEDGFDGKLGKGWTWLREDAKTWRIKDKALEIRVEPGKRHNVKNALLRDAPDRRTGAYAFELTVTNTVPPTQQWEQGGLTWYHGGKPVFKIVKELVDGKVCIIPGRKPMPSRSVQLRIVVRGDRYSAQYRADAKGAFHIAATGKLPPASSGKKDQISIQCYNGPRDAVHWIRFDDFRILKLSDADPTPPNTLTAKEKKDGWRLLFDGKTTKGWRGYKMKVMPKGWQVIDGALVRVSGGKGGKGAGGGDDIITVEQFDDFELSLEWKVVASGNSGILYRVTENAATAWHVAPEMQVLDNTPHRRRDKRQLAGALYDLYAASKDVALGPGKWNRVRIVARGKHVEHWLNGVKIVQYELSSEDWKRRVARSKFRNMPNFAKAMKGHICLQDHTRRLEYRSIKIRPLDPTDKTDKSKADKSSG